MVDYIIRPMKIGDIPQVAEIDHEAFPGEWLFRSHASYKQDLKSSLAHYVVACTEEEREVVQELPWFKRLFSHNHLPSERKYTTDYIVGFAGFWLMLKEAHIIAIATRNNYRRMGIGEGLLISVIELATQLNANVVTLEVRASNEIAQALYKKYGFQEVRRRPRYYSDNGEDAILMHTDYIASASFQTRFQQLKEAHEKSWEGLSPLLK